MLVSNSSQEPCNGSVLPALGLGSFLTIPNTETKPLLEGAQHRVYLFYS